MTARFDHTVIAARDAAASAEFHRELLEADPAPSWGPFVNLSLDGGVLLHFAALPQEEFPEIQNQHQAFLVDDAHLDRALQRIRAEGRDHWADPQRTKPGQTNTEHGGRGVYLLDPVGHYLELTTAHYV
ncbi:Glyoxalase-like domain-containing protein [Klenkia marina]|uniref:Glyoxalase-like domain-containing protein n=1 Tax=Klenkia marina TaxID=1960309 RepID=A0A1G4Z269_9ACTN|nr:VOC family protein [Klenkia marina]SCX59759.1 Glyoxalase-like domain-containing protein [Klenkia marina]